MLRFKPVLRLAGVAILLGLVIISTHRSGNHTALSGEPAPSHVPDDRDIGLSERFNGPIRATSPATDGSGDTYAAGDFSLYQGRAVGPIVRLRQDGSLDERFQMARGGQRRIAAIAQADDASGDLYVAGYALEPTGQGGWRFTSTVWRIHLDGTTDVRFAPATFHHDDTYVPDPRSVPLVTGLASVGDGSGRVYAAGRMGVVRLQRDGRRDLGFRYGESAFHVVPAKDAAGTVYVTSNERIAPSGRHASQRLVRLNADGTRDPSFKAGSGVAPAWDIITVVPVDDGSGDLFVGGDFANYGDPNPHDKKAVRLLARLDADGTVDRTSLRPQIDERHGAVVALTRADDGSGDWLVRQSHATLRYGAEGARVPDVATGPVPGAERRAVASAALPSTTAPAPSTGTRE